MNNKTNTYLTIRAAVRFFFYFAVVAFVIVAIPLIAAAANWFSWVFAAILITIVIILEVKAKRS